MNYKMYWIRCITNLHMGSGDINFNIVDNEVQRDPITGYPSMFSSGIKGALREKFEACANDKVTGIFGSSVDESNKTEAGKNIKSKSVPGKIKFLSGNLLAIPVRASKGKQAYYMVTTKEILNQYVMIYSSVTGEKIRLDNIENNAYANEKVVGIDNITLINCEKIPEEIKNIFVVAGIDENKLVIVPDEQFRKVHLPVLARNYLVNGESKNLFYEEVVPHEAIFYTAVLSDGTEGGDNALKDFANIIKEDKLVQFGGDATIGYGLTEMIEIKVAGRES